MQACTWHFLLHAGVFPAVQKDRRSGLSVHLHLNGSAVKLLTILSMDLRHLEDLRHPKSACN